MAQRLKVVQQVNGLQRQFRRKRLSLKMPVPIGQPAPALAHRPRNGHSGRSDRAVLRDIAPGEGRKTVIVVIAKAARGFHPHAARICQGKAAIGAAHIRHKVQLCRLVLHLRLAWLFTQDDHSQEVIVGYVLDVNRANELAVLHDRGAVTQLHHIVDVVADQEDTDAFGLQLRDQFRHHLRLVRTQRRSGFIHDQDTCVEIDGARDGHRLALTARQGADGVLELLKIRVEARHDLARLRLHRVVIHKTDGRHQLASQKQVRGRIQIVRQRERLVNRLDVVGAGVTGRVDRDLFTVHKNLARIHAVSPRQDLDQRRFPGPVVTQQAHNFARIEINRHVIDRFDPAKADRDVFHFHKWRCHLGSPYRPARRR
mmetsp:Transcript_27482/g.50762  ORF Transcript_27482/g.50762 Transcript_27482/m.50762 type:complete len:370 (-) Transcript_27482:67-1176(-)